MTRLLAAALALALVGCSGAPVRDPNTPLAALKGDATRGRTAFAACAYCHGVIPGAQSLGPTLYGVVGRVAGSVPDYAYSDAMKRHVRPWTREHLYAYLLNPQAVVPGTKMGYGGMPDPQSRADVIAYLETLR